MNRDYLLDSRLLCPILLWDRKASERYKSPTKPLKTARISAIITPPTAFCIVGAIYGFRNFIAVSTHWPFAEAFFSALVIVAGAWGIWRVWNGRWSELALWRVAFVLMTVAILQAVHAEYWRKEAGAKMEWKQVLSPNASYAYPSCYLGPFKSLAA